MANASLFASALNRLLPRADVRAQAGGAAYALGPEAKLAQLAATGTLADGFYSSAEPRWPTCWR
jgi:60 kDa SS-A/Ro ribonucleoprotein